jgi:peptidoglycan/LPS O-acetylase OafA/YrhL
VVAGALVDSVVPSSHPQVESDAPGGVNYRPALDGLRFVAFAAVLLHHSLPLDGWKTVARHSPELAQWANAFVRSLSFGVSLFFALSAYLITNLLLREWSRYGTVSLRAFYARRSLRIWPLYFTFLAFTIFVLPRISHVNELDVRYQPYFWLFGANWACTFWDYPASPNGPLWSISTEEQFYLFWPLLLRFLPGRPVTYIAVGMLILANAVRVVLALQGAPIYAVSYNPLCQLDPIAAGILLAAAPDPGGFAKQHLWPWVLAACGVLVVLIRFLGHNALAAVFVYPLASVVCLLALVATLNSPGARFLTHPAIVYLGKISFGLYVFHALCLYLISPLVQVGSSAIFTVVRLAVVFPLTVALAAASYRFLELPFLRLKERFARVPSRA